MSRADSSAWPRASPRLATGGARRGRILKPLLPGPCSGLCNLPSSFRSAGSGFKPPTFRCSIFPVAYLYPGKSLLLPPRSPALFDQLQYAGAGIPSKKKPTFPLQQRGLRRTNGPFQPSSGASWLAAQIGWAGRWCPGAGGRSGGDDAALRSRSGEDRSGHPLADRGRHGQYGCTGGSGPGASTSGRRALSRCSKTHMQGQTAERGRAGTSEVGPPQYPIATRPQFKARFRSARLR